MLIGSRTLSRRTRFNLLTLEERITPSWGATPPATIAVPNNALAVTLTNNDASGSATIATTENDFYTFTATASGSYLFTAAKSGTSNIDTVAALYSSSGSRLGFNDDSNGTTNSRFTATLTAGTRYYLGVTNYTNTAGGAYTWGVDGPAVAAPPSGPVFNSISGYGRVDAAAAVSSALGVATFANVPSFGGANDWNLNSVYAPEVWAAGYTGAGIVVAVVDTGVDYTHPDLDGAIWTNAREVAGDGIDNDNNGFIDDTRGWDFSANDNNPMDENNHGTHVAGSIAGENNGTGVTGVAYGARIMPVRVLAANGSGSSASVANGIRYAANNGANVINLSLGSSSPDATIQSAVQYAFSRGVVVVMAAGNDGASAPGYPARYATSYGIAVGAYDINNNFASFSNKAGTTVLDYVAAPGVSVYSSIRGGGYANFSGTSMATPQVAGIAALILSANRSLTPAQVESILTRTAVSSGVNGTGTGGVGSGSGGIGGRSLGMVSDPVDAIPAAPATATVETPAKREKPPTVADVVFAAPAVDGRPISGLIVSAMREMHRATQAADEAFGIFVG